MSPEDLDEAADRGTDLWPFLQDARLFLTGGTGFLGRWILALLLRAEDRFRLGLSVTCLSREPERFQAECPDLANHPAVSWCAGDVRFYNFPPGRFTHVIHAAADTSAEADARPFELIDTIVDGTRRVLGHAQSMGARMLFLSSGAVYGVNADAMTPSATYGQAKRMAEQLANLHHHYHRLHVTTARGFAFAGPHMALEGHFAFGNFIADALAGRTIEVKGDGRPVRSYLYAADAALWFLTLLLEGQPGAVYDVGSPHAVSIAELATRVGSLLGAPVTIRGVPSPESPRQLYLPDTGPAERDFGLEAWTDLDQAIRRTADWVRSARPAPRTPSVPSPKTFVVDIDGVLASLTPGNDYRLAEPLRETIAAVNRLYDAGHRIILFTARGSGTGICWQDLTRQQMAAWGVRHHELRFGKPAADYYIDDRLLSLPDLLRLSESQ